MKLSEYMRGMPEADKLAFATACKTTVSYLYVLAGGHRKTKHAKVLLIEEASRGKVTRHDLYPEIYGEPAKTARLRSIRHR